MHTTIYRAQTYTKVIYFIKLKNGHCKDTFYTILTLLQDVGIQQIIPLVKTIDGKSVQYIDGFTLFVFPFITDQNGFSRALTGENWAILGKTLRKIHEIEVPLSVKNNIRQEVYSSKWRDAICTLYTYIKSEPDSDGLGLKFMTFMRQYAATIHHLVARAEQLAQQISTQRLKFVLCHGDIHGGNVLIGKNNSIYIVDWDDPVIVPKERDLMFIGAGVANVWNKLSETKLFYKGYGKTEIDMSTLAYYRCERIIEDIVLYAQQILFANPEDQLRIKSYKPFIAQFEPKGVVEIALKTEAKLIL